jgi:hypothetical protein
MECLDFTTTPAQEHEGWPIAECPRCGRRGRVQPRAGGGHIYDHVSRPLEPGIAGVHTEVVEWCEVREPEVVPCA